MSPASRRRRRLLALGFLIGAAVLFFCRDFVAPLHRKKAMLCAPALFLLGVSALLYPATIPDPRHEFGIVGAVSESGSRPMIVGGVLMFLGFVIGVWLVFNL